jgi:hypothetical protein
MKRPIAATATKIASRPALNKDKLIVDVLVGAETDNEEEQAEGDQPGENRLFGGLEVDGILS